MNILVTGARGFLGSYLIRGLQKDPAVLKINALVRNGTPTFQNFDPLKREESFRIETQVDWILGDVTRKSTLRHAFDKIDTVFHLASKVSLFSSDRTLLESVNVQGTRNIVELCQEFQVKRLIHISSVAAVGASASGSPLPLNEETSNPLRKFKFPNIESKAKGEEIVLEACRRGEVDAVVVNPSMIFGGGDAKKPPRKGNILAARGKLSFYTQGGISVVAVEDVVDGILSAWKHGRKGERYIFSGENLTLRELLTLYSELTGVSPPRFAMPSAFVRTMGHLIELLPLKIPFNRESAQAATLYHWYDHSKARRELGFDPKPARDAIQASVTWMRENGYIEVG